MADDIKEPDLTQPIKRLNYFTGQFLEKEDFLDEQQYHLAMRRRGNRVLYFGMGVLDESGFRINDLGAGKIEVTPGVAIDAEGREIVLVKEIEIDLPPLNLQPNSDFVVTVEYDKQARDEQSTNDNDRSDFTRVLEEPEIKVVSPGSQSATAIVIANLVTKADGTVEKIEYGDRQRAKARFAGDLTIGQGGNGSLNTRHINGKDWRNDTADDLYLNWNSAKNVVLGFGEGTRSSLHVSGNVGIGTMSPRAALEIRGPNSPTGNAGQREIALGFEAAGSARIRAYRGNSWDTTLQFLTNSAATGSDNPAVRLHIGEDGKVGIGTTTPRAKLEVAGGAIMPAAGNSDASGILFPLDPGGGGGDKAWIRYYARAPRVGTSDTSERMALEIGVHNDGFEHSGDNQDDILLMPSGGVGIGENHPAGRLHIRSSQGHAAVVEVTTAAGKAIAILTDSNIAYTNGRNMKRILGAGEFRITHYEGFPSFGTPAMGVNLVALHCPFRSGLTTPSTRYTIYTNLVLPINAVLNSLRIRHAAHREHNVGTTQLECKFYCYKVGIDVLGNYDNEPIVHEELLQTTNGTHTTTPNLTIGELSRTVQGHHQHFLLFFHIGGTSGTFALNWIEVNYTLFDITI